MSLDREAATRAPGSRPPRELDDPRAMRAVAHPVRLALLQALGQREPLTATEAGEMIGESPTTCSFHLRMLAKYGFVEEAGQAGGRRRPWRLSHSGFTFPAVHEDPERSLAAGGLVTSAAETVAYVTLEEAQRLKADLWALLGRYRDRLEDHGLRPENAIPLEMLLFTYPLDLGGRDHASDPAGE